MNASSPSPYKSTGGLRRLLNALRYSIQGLGAALRHEAAFRQELALCVVLVPVALWLGHNLTERLALIAALLFVLVIEIINSAIEALADSISLDRHPLLGRAKDLGSAAVLLAIAFAACIWIAVLAGPAST